MHRRWEAMMLHSTVVVTRTKENQYLSSIWVYYSQLGWIFSGCNTLSFQHSKFSTSLAAERSKFTDLACNDKIVRQTLNEERVQAFISIFFAVTLSLFRSLFLAFFSRLEQQKTIQTKLSPNSQSIFKLFAVSAAECTLSQSYTHRQYV